MNSAGLAGLPLPCPLCGFVLVHAERVSRASSGRRSVCFFILVSLGVAVVEGAAGALEAMVFVALDRDWIGEECFVSEEVELSVFGEVTQLLQV